MGTPDSFGRGGLTSGRSLLGGKSGAEDSFLGVGAVGRGGVWTKRGFGGVIEGALGNGGMLGFASEDLSTCGLGEGEEGFF